MEIETESLKRFSTGGKVFKGSEQSRSGSRRESVHRGGVFRRHLPRVPAVSFRETSDELRPTSEASDSRDVDKLCLYRSTTFK